MESPVVKTENLTKEYGRKTAVSSLDLQVKENEIFGLIGPNGSGKTTTLLMLLGLTEPTSGTCEIGGLDPLRNPIKVKGITGYIPERVGFYENMSAIENLLYLARLNNIYGEDARKRISESLETVGLIEEKNVNVEGFSQGMRQRLAIASLLVKRPEIVFLDEPTVGLDPEGIDEILNLITRMKEEWEMTVICSSHLLHQIRRISDRVGMMINGKLKAVKKISELEEEFSSVCVAEVSEVTDRIIDSVRDIPLVEEVEVDGKKITARGEGEFRGRLAKEIVKNGGEILRLGRESVDLSDFYKKYSEGE